MRLRIVGTAVAGTLLSCFLVAPLWADDGSLAPEFVKRLRGSVKMDASTRALQNALTSGDPKAMVLNRRIVQQHDNVFSHKIKAKEITNQAASGRCWMFASLNILRPVVIEKHKLKDFEFSESYVAFWDKLEKANAFLEDMIALADRKPLDRELDFLLSLLSGMGTDGGYWDFAVALIEKHGLVPKSIMPETHNSQNTAAMNSVLERVLRIDATKLRALAAQKKSLDELRAAKKRMLAQIYRILVLNYGEPPAEFTYRFVSKKDKVGPAKRYTPQSFYKECVGVDLSQYVTLGHDPTNDYRRHYRLRRIRGVVGAPEFHYVNAPIETLKQTALKSVLADEPVWFGADVTHDMDRADGIMQVGLFDFGAAYGVDLTHSKADRLLMRGAVSNHAMVFLGVDVRDGKPVKWLVENSWGGDRGNKGFWTMYDRWFNENVFSIVIRKAYVPNDLLAIYQEDAVELPPWAPMFAPTR